MTICQSLVLHSSCAPERAGINKKGTNKNDIPNQKKKA
jgi:hypothetical protein